MQLEERYRRIEAYLQKMEFALLEELAREVGASVSTVRRDLSALEATGTVKRTHGGARVVNPRSDEFMFSARNTHQLTEKEAIGKACTGLIQPNQTIIIDAGTTCFHVARHLQDKAPHIITNSLPVANHFAGANHLEIVLSGGVIYPRLGVLVGPLAVEAFSKIHADIAIMSAGGISVEGVSNSHGLLIDIQRAMINAVQKVIFCIDHTKFGRQSVLPLCDLDTVDTVVTDSKAPADLLETLRSRQIEVIVAP
jgi:DeoR family fructose operon transcriptional repressor